MADQVIFTTDFSTGVDKALQWLDEPKKTECIPPGPNGKGGLHIVLDAKHDFWQKTFYDPLLVKDDGHVLYLTSKEPYVVMETAFTVKAINQFDQGGLIVRLDSEHWIKTGLEFVDGKLLLSCVVTNINSDWSTQEWPSMHLHIRIFRQYNDFVVEASADGEKWNLIRICHLDVPKDNLLKMGLVAAAPTAAGGTVVFENLSLKTSTPHPQTTP